MKHLIIIVFICVANLAAGQKYFSKAGKISFYSNAPLEKIEAHNNSASTVIDVSNGNMEWAVLIQGFKFDKALMQEHFNENYMESAKYPKAKFKGKIDNFSTVNFSKDGEYPVDVSGQLEIHGVTNPVTAKGTLTVKNGTITANSKFSVQVADYKIDIPKVVADNIAKTVEITVIAEYQAMASMQ